jgi:beta-1,4-mannosyl-glycoprotein beta-1,4-N-acetylglucosaminyltransferase
MIFDCFTFFNELELLEIRLHEMNEVADYFVIVEATKTHQGDPKPLYFDKHANRFQQWLPKIRHIVVDFPDNLDAAGSPGLQPGITWARERYQRDQIMRGLTCTDSDIIIISDLDEIPSAEGVKKYKPEYGICYFEMMCFFYYLNCHVGMWTHAKIMPYRALKVNTPSYIRNVIKGAQWPNGGGWHYSYMGGPERVVQKFNAFAHVEYKNFMGVEQLRKLMDAGLSIIGDPGFAHKQWNSFPKYVEENRAHYEQLGFIRYPSK